MAITNLIAQAGQNPNDPIARFMQGQQLQQQQQLQQLQGQQAQQQIGLQRQQGERAQQEFEIKMSAPVIREIESIEDPVEKETAYQRGLELLGSRGIDINNVPETYAELKSSGMADAITDLVYGQTKGNRVNAQLDGEIVPAIELETGELVDPLTRRKMPTAIKAPMRQITGAPGDFPLTKSQAGEARNKFIDKTIQARKFTKLSNQVMQNIGENASQLGVVGAIARMGDEVKSIAKNVGSEFGIETSGISKNIGDYEFGTLAPQSAAFKTNALSLALIFASASGLGEGRALTNKDVQRAIDAIGASTNSPEQLFARMGAIQQNLQDSLQIEAEERGFEFGGIPEMKPQQPQQQIPEGTTATNPQTKQKVIYTNGKWQPAP
jgi:hypothetical protein